MIDHSFIFDWRHVAVPLTLTVIVMAIGAAFAFSQ
jgi:hypothetical protein